MNKEKLPIVLFAVSLISLVLIALHEFEYRAMDQQTLTDHQKEVLKHTRNLQRALMTGDLELTEARYYIEK